MFFFSERELHQIALHMLNSFGGELPVNYNFSIDEYFERYYPGLLIKEDRKKVYMKALQLVACP